MSPGMRRFLHGVAVHLGQQGGAVSAEYGLLLGLIAIVIVVALTAFGVAVAGLIDRGTAAFP